MLPVIIPFYKNKDQLEKCLHHLKNQTVITEAYIHDNSHKNLYFTAAINEGIKQYLERPCKYIIVLNQDMYLEQDAVEQMIDFMESHRKCGIGTPLQMHPTLSGYVANAGGLRTFPTGNHYHGKLSQFERDAQIPWANGACIILRKQMIQEIGLLDANMRLYGSDSDYSLTARARGWEIWRIVRARGVHEHGISSDIRDLRMEKIKLEDMLYFAKKWITGDLFRQLAHENDHHSTEEIEKYLSDFLASSNAISKHIDCFNNN